MAWTADAFANAFAGLAVAICAVLALIVLWRWVNSSRRGREQPQVQVSCSRQHEDDWFELLIIFRNREPEEITIEAIEAADQSPARFLRLEEPVGSARNHYKSRAFDRNAATPRAELKYEVAPAGQQYPYPGPRNTHFRVLAHRLPPHCWITLTWHWNDRPNRARRSHREVLASRRRDLDWAFAAFPSSAADQTVYRSSARLRLLT